MIPRIAVGLAAAMICTAVFAQAPAGAPVAPAKTPAVLKRNNDAGMGLPPPTTAPAPAPAPVEAKPAIERPKK
jgi:hypothetical protein